MPTNAQNASLAASRLVSSRNDPPLLPRVPERRPGQGHPAHDGGEGVAYNKVLRFGCAQFVDGKCVYEGHVSKEIIAAVEAAEKEKRT